ARARTGPDAPRPGAWRSPSSPRRAHPSGRFALIVSSPERRTSQAPADGRDLPRVAGDVNGREREHRAYVLEDRVVRIDLLVERLLRQVARDRGEAVVRLFEQGPQNARVT